MINRNDVVNTLTNTNNVIKGFVNYLDTNQEQFKIYYDSEFNNYKNNIYKDVNGNDFRLKYKDHYSFYEIIKTFLGEQIDFINQFQELIKNGIKEECENKLSIYMEKLIINCINSINKYNSLSYCNFNECFNLLYKTNLSKNYSAIFYLEYFSKYEKDIVLIGGNGSGKTSFANLLKGNDNELIAVIPAQKNLYFSVNDPYLSKTSKDDLKKILIENNIEKGKTDINGNDYYNYQNTQFSKLIIGMQTDYIGYLCKSVRENTLINIDETVFGKVRNVFQTLFPEIDLIIDEDSNNSIKCIKQEKKYSINGLSEGEKAVLYYSISVFIAKDNGFIIVDEPETYLNPSITNTLWDLLTKEKNNCQFIFITHSIDFVLGRNNKVITWIKDYKYPNLWIFDTLDEENELPNSMLTEILGSKKPIVFCEGNDKNSLDYHVYRAIFGNDYTIIPANGHNQVVSCCRAVNNIESKINLNNKAYGIIDGDLISDNAKAKYKEDNIFVLPFNEIEMLLLEENLISKTLSSSYPKDYQNRIDRFMNKLWEKIDQNKGQIALSYAKSFIDEKLSTYTIKSKSNLNEIKKELDHISKIDINKIYENKIKELDEIIATKDYKKLLQVCNLKKVVCNEIANIYFDSHYIEKAKQHITTKNELQEYLRSNYFSFLNTNKV